MENYTQKSNSRLINSRSFLESHQWDLDAAADAFADFCADEYADACADASCDAYADACADASCDAYADACADAAVNFPYQSRSRFAPFAAREPYQQRSLRRPKRRQEEQKNSASGTRGGIRTRADSYKTRLGDSYSWRQRYYTGGETRLSTVNNKTRSLRRHSSPPSSSNTKLFVGGLSWSLDEKSFKNAFSSFGKITEVKIIYDRDSGRSRGFGFVHFSKEEDAIYAKDAMNGKALSGRPLRIRFAHERVPVRNANDFFSRSITRH